MAISVKHWLVGITIAAVVSDSMLLPFYPHFFASVFGITDPGHIGLYLSACCLTIVLAFPMWARISRRIPVLQLLIPTQLAAGGLSILCYWAETPVSFWILSLVMLVFKGSYLLVYPMIMAAERKDNHGNTIGLLSVVVHIGGIAGAVLGGVVLQWFEPRQVFLVMAVSDFLQTGVCLYLLRRPDARADFEEPSTAMPEKSRVTSTVIYKLGLVMFLFYFSAYLTRPFFVRYWESVTGAEGEVLSGLVFAIPAGIAILALWLNFRRGHTRSPGDGLLTAMMLGSVGLALQGLNQEWLILSGRCLFGWALFQATVQLDQLLFALSQPESYATDFSKINIFQQLGVLAAASSAGGLVGLLGLQIPFAVAAAGLVFTAAVYGALFHRTRRELQPST
ncbi:MFS transporter [Marinobacter sp. GN3S48]|uniref:MFS transporter n=1 Tax=Marinobacter sp. GN3S48 TaxID=3382302 RepID=UPI00387ABB54